MINNLRILIICIFLSVSSLSYCGQENTFRESKIGGFDFSTKLISNQKLMNLYGKGCADKNYPYHYRRLYYFPQKEIYAAFDIGTDNLVVGLKLTKEPIISKKCNAIKPLKNYETSKKITLGDSKEKVIKAYGSPSIEDVKTNQVILYRYYVGNEEGSYMEIELLNNRVISIWVTVSE